MSTCEPPEIDALGSTWMHMSSQDTSAWLLYQCYSRKAGTRNYSPRVGPSVGTSIRCVGSFAWKGCECRHPIWATLDCLKHTCVRAVLAEWLARKNTVHGLFRLWAQVYVVLVRLLCQGTNVDILYKQWLACLKHTCAPIMLAERLAEDLQSTG